jgi:ABC-type branched-subunit amino acid transport system permease subunit
VIAMVVLGGMGSISGWCSQIVLTLLPEVLRPVRSTAGDLPAHVDHFGDHAIRRGLLGTRELSFRRFFPRRPAREGA